MTTQLLQIRNDSKHLLGENSPNHLLNWNEHNRLLLSFGYAICSWHTHTQSSACVCKQDYMFLICLTFLKLNENDRWTGK